MKTKNLKLFFITSFIFIVVFSLFFIPHTMILAAGLVPCKDGCTFNDIFTLIENVIHFIFYDIALPLAAVSFAYAGFELVTSGGSTEKKSKAKKIFINVAIGLVIVAAAFLIVKTVLQVSGYKTGGDWNWFGLED